MINIIGVIGQDVTAKTVMDELKASGDSAEMIISSGGGDIMEGFAIHDAIKASGKAVTAKVVGVCASAATIIACAANSVEISANSDFMVHNPYSMSGGDADDMESNAKLLRSIESRMLGIYAEKTGKAEDELREIMKSETWFTADEAIESNFANSILATVDMAACVKGKVDKVISEHNTNKEPLKMAEVQEDEKIEKGILAFFKNLMKAEAPKAEDMPEEVVEEEAPEMEANAKRDKIAVAMSGNLISNAQGLELMALSLEEVSAKIDAIEKPIIQDKVKTKVDTTGDILAQYESAIADGEQFAFYQANKAEILKAMKKGN